MFRNRQSVITQIGLLRLNLHQLNNRLGLDTEDARKEAKRLKRAPEAEVKELFRDLHHEWNRPQTELER